MYGFQPLVTWPIAQLFSPELAGGLIVASIVPCTLASAASGLAERRAMMRSPLTVTVVTNAICFLVAPTWLWLLLGQDADSGRWIAQIPKLALLVVAPMILAQILRRSDRIAQGSKKHKLALGVVAQIGILAMVLLGTAQIPAKLESVPVLDSVGGIIVMSLVVVGIHVISLMAAGIFREASNCLMPTRQRLRFLVVRRRDGWTLARSRSGRLGSSVDHVPRDSALR